MTAERREAASPNPAGGEDSSATGHLRTSEFTAEPRVDPPTVLAPADSDPPPPPDSDAPLPRAFGRYLVRRALGAGGFGTVYLGHDSELDRPVAIKVLHGGPSVPQHRSERFFQEARRVAGRRDP